MTKLTLLHILLFYFYSYEKEKLKENCIVVKDLRVDEMSIVTIVE